MQRVVGLPPEGEPFVAGCLGIESDSDDSRGCRLIETDLLFYRHPGNVVRIFCIRFAKPAATLRGPFHKQRHTQELPILAVLELLKDDPARYVQRSVANNLNDIAKDNPALTLDTCRRWAEDAPTARAWIIRRALRSLVEAGNSEAIGILGGEAIPLVRITRTNISVQSVAMGEAVQLSFDVESMAGAPQRLMIDYAVHFVKGNGAARPKVFKLRTLTLQPGQTIVCKATVSFAPMTTRRHYPGHHRVDVLINGTAHPLGQFEVLA